MQKYYSDPKKMDYSWYQLLYPICMQDKRGLIHRFLLRRTLGLGSLSEGILCMLIPFSTFRELLHPKTTHFSTIFSVTIEALPRIFGYFCTMSFSYVTLHIWTHLAKNISSKISQGVGIISRLRHFLPTSTLLRIYGSLIEPYISYGLAAWGQAAASNLNKILLLQKRALVSCTFLIVDLMPSLCQLRSFASEYALF